MTTRKFLRSVALGFGLAATAGCSALSSIESASKPLDTYELSSLPAGSVAAARSRRTLEVALPTATGALTSDRIVIKPTPLKIEALPDARWVNEATEHVQLLLVRSLAGSGRFALVSGAGSGPQPDYVLLTDLQDFQAEVAPDEAVVVIRTTMTLLSNTDGRVISSRSFTNTTTVPDTATESIVAAFDQAMTQQLGDVVGWLVNKAGL
ncbi:MAG: ABC-type transport auxiliary lipoprotein family protein [Paracoccaceae bacterium]